MDGGFTQLFFTRLEENLSRRARRGTHKFQSQKKAMKQKKHEQREVVNDQNFCAYLYCSTVHLYFHVGQLKRLVFSQRFTRLLTHGQKSMCGSLGGQSEYGAQLK